jgi:hypothetical protein
MIFDELRIISGNKRENVWRLAPPHILRQNYLFQIFSLDIASIYQFFLVVADINANRGQQVGRHNFDAVVVGLGIVDINLLALQSLINHLGGLCSQQAGVLEDGVALFAGDDRLDGSNFGILTSHNRAGLGSSAVTNTLQGGEDTNAEAIIGGQHTINFFVGVERAQKIVHASLGSRGRSEERRVGKECTG